ncbi:QsdR family transcriptional regulator [Microbacterium sp. BWT-B31]|uniref:TetR/AcrR family transcriptional regulator n=1 Tax=Microbacterium sp. BWT-B31 TaxID=3232072 RepID=UPI00352862B2
MADSNDEVPKCAFFAAGTATMSTVPSPKHQLRVTDDEIVDRATALYLAARPIDMSSLAADLGLSRATLYRRVGNHEDLLGTVLSAQTEATFRSVRRPRDVHGLTAVTTTLEAFIHAIMASAPVRSLIERDAALFIRVVMGRGPVEDSASRMIAELLEEELSGQLDADPALLARAIVRLSDAMIYTHLLGDSEPEVDEAVTLVRMLLDAAVGR